MFKADLNNLDGTLMLDLGVFLIASGLTYAIYSALRVVLLRQHLFDARDELFDEAARLGALNDPAYRQARDHLNAWAREAHALSWPLIMYCFAHETPDPDLKKTENMDLQVAIDCAFEKAAMRTWRYLTMQTLPGLFLTVFFSLYRMSQVQKKFGLTVIRGLIGSDLPSSKNVDGDFGGLKPA